MRMRVRMRPWTGAVWLVQPAVAPLALLEFLDGLQQVNAAEVRPVGLSDVDLGVSRLPKQEVAQAHLAAGADDQIEFGEVAGVEMPVNGLFVDAQVFEPTVI